MNIKYLLTLFILLFAGKAQAIDLLLEPVYSTYQNNNLDNALGVEIRVGYKNAFLWASYEAPLLRFGGQECIDLQILGAGIGARTPLYYGFRGFFGIGYYKISSTIKWPFYLDGYLYAFQEFLGTTQEWEHVDYQIKDSMGSMIGVQYQKNITDDLFIGGMIDYRFLRASQSIYGWNGELDPEAMLHWEVSKYEKLSSIRVGIFLKGKI